MAEPNYYGLRADLHDMRMEILLARLSQGPATERELLADFPWARHYLLWLVRRGRITSEQFRPTVGPRTNLYALK